MAMPCRGGHFGFPQKYSGGRGPSQFFPEQVMGLPKRQSTEYVGISHTDGKLMFPPVASPTR